MKRYMFGFVLCSILLLVFACKDDENMSIMASFNLSGEQLYAKCPIEFINASPDAISYLWDFGDGNTSTETDPIHTYDTPGNYTVTLTVSDENIENKATQTVEINQGSLTFENTYALGDSDYCRGMVASPDGGYALAGYTYNQGANSPYMVNLTKVDAKGNVQWEKTYGEGRDNRAYAIITSSDGGYVLAGYTKSQGAVYKDVYAIKVDANGDLQWERTFGEVEHDHAYAITAASDGGYVFLGYTRAPGSGLSDLYAIKVDANGDLQWERTFGESEHDHGYAITTSSDGGYILTGDKGVQWGEDLIYAIKLDANGNLQWEKTHGGSGSDIAYAITTSSDGGYILAGSTDSQGAGEDDIYLIKVDANGNLQWEKTFGGSGSDIAYAITTSSDGGYILAGSTNSQGAGEDDAYLIKVDVNGNLQWEKTFGGSDIDNAYAIKTTDECGSGYIVAGRKGAEFYVIKTDTEGNVN